MNRLTWRYAIALCALATACRGEAESFVRGSGTIEVVETGIAPLVPARLALLLVIEGDSVSAGDTIAILTQSAITSEIELRQARVTAAEAAVRDLVAGARPAEIERVRAEQRAAVAEVERTTKEVGRARALLAAQAISQSKLDDALLAQSVATSRRDALDQSIRLLEEGTRDDRIRAARAEVNAAQAGLAAARASSADLVLTAPVGGIVLATNAEPGEVIGAGIPIVTLGDLSRPWVRVFVAAPMLPHMRIGQETLGAIQGLDAQLIEGRVVAIDSRAQFTPRIALTEDERADLMFGVKVELGTGVGVVKPGLPIDVLFDTTGVGFPATLTEGKTIVPLTPARGGG